MRTIIVGDVHGCLEELEALIALLSPGASDRWIFVGDLVDRGPDSIGVVRRVIELVRSIPGSAVVMGNHEERALSLRDRGRPGGEPWTKLADEDVWSFLGALPLLVRLPEHRSVVVHAGFFPAYFQHHGPVGEVDPDWRQAHGKRAERLRRFLRVCNVDRGGAMLGLDAPAELVAGHWSRFYRGEEGHAFFGHDPQLAPPTPLLTPFATGLDTGCCFGGRLTAAVLEPGTPPVDAELVSVPARARYAEPRAHGGW